MRIGICGAGVGGFSTAVGLLSLGHEVVVFERAPDIRTTGAGFNLWPRTPDAQFTDSQVYANNMRISLSISTAISSWIPRE